LIKDVVKYF